MTSSKLLLDIEGTDTSFDNDEGTDQNNFVKACEEILEEYDKSNNTKEQKRITPKAGFCIKTSESNSEKVFINICHCSELPFEDISEEELKTLLNNEEPSSYRVPMSLGEPHSEKDRSSNSCTVYDVAVNSLFYQKVENIEVFKYFLISVALEGVEEKYNCKLNRENCIVLKNKNCFGTIQDQCIRSTPRRLITELEADKIPSTSGIITKPSEEFDIPEPPNYVLWKEPAESEIPDRIVGEFHLKETQLTDIILDLGEDRLVLENSKGKFSPIDIFFPYLIDKEKSQARFDKSTGVLKVTLPVTGS